MKEQKTKASPKLGGRTSPIERYNTRTDRKTSQSGPLVFSAFVFALFFVVAIAAGVALVRGIDVWVVLVAFGVASPRPCPSISRCSGKRSSSCASASSTASGARACTSPSPSSTRPRCAPTSASS